MWFPHIGGARFPPIGGKFMMISTKWWTVEDDFHLEVEYSFHLGAEHDFHK